MSGLARWCRSELTAGLVALSLVIAAGPALAAAQTAGESPGVSDQVYTGWKYFQVYCSRCHGDDALGTMAAPDLTYSLTEEGGVTADSFKVIVHQGSSSPSAAPDQQMRGFGDLLDSTLVDALYSYVRARSDGSLGTGRPRRAASTP